MTNRLNRLRNKEVVNINDGARLGCISDIEFDVKQGIITAIVVPGPYKFFGLLPGSEDIVIPFCEIEKFGDDIILVNIDWRGCCQPKYKKERILK